MTYTPTSTTEAPQETEVTLTLPIEIVAQLNMIARLANQPVNAVVNVILAMTIYQQAGKA